MALQSTIEANSQIKEYASIWLTGVSEGKMDATETLIFESLVVNLNDLVFYVSASEDELTGNDMSTNVVVADFAALLHRNPCARKVWELREDRLARSRAALDPNSDSDSDESYVEKIMSVLRILDDTSPG